MLRKRRGDRGITLPQMFQIIETGWHEKKKDTFKEEFGVWNYAIRGISVDGRDIRVIVSFQADSLVMITAMEVTNGNKNRS